MRNDEARSKPVILPVRLPLRLYEDLGRLAEGDVRNRCSVIRKLIADAARRAQRRAAREAARG
jgi:hypothetical protein